MHLTKESFPVDREQQSLIIPNSDGVRQSTLAPLGKTIDFAFEDARTNVQAFYRGQKVSKNGPCLGWRDEDPEYKWLNYQEVIERFQNISYGLLHAGMKRGQDTFVGIYAQNCVEWVLVEYACYCQSAIIVPLYDTLGPTACSFILRHVDAEFLICDTVKKVKNILDSKEEIPKLRHIIVFQEVSEDVKQLSAQKEVTLHQLKAIEESGKSKPDILKLPDASDIATICYTSGTTGTPKGVILTHRNMVACASGVIRQLGLDFGSCEDRVISYLPMAHMFDRISQLILYMIGGSVGFFRGDIRLLAEDIKSLKPTMIPAVPRVLNKIYDKIQSEVQSNPLKKILLDFALRSKKIDLERGVIRNDSLLDRLVLKSIQNAFGGRMRLLVSAGAPIRDDVLSFFKYSLGCVVTQSYGQTESTAGVVMNVVGDYENDNAGPPLTSSHVKLIDVPDMGYYAKDGKGEILAKGSSISKGYYKDPEKTAEILDNDGWLHTGDIGQWKKNGSLSIIDRKKHLFKLSQGEYISPEKVEAVCLGCHLLDQIFVHGDSLESCLVAIAVPEKESLLSWCSQQNITGELKEICQNEEVKEHILKELQQLGVKAGLKGYEQVKAIHLHPEVLSHENGLLTVTMKLKRPQCAQYFKDAIKRMYGDLRKKK